ncbi:hypothetical protein PAXRUDRAFT_19538 [Paxillus rubicundulus Ve08.2h10]|uniref:Uncharacterized protein n=1 Tax=Paxillus rubicundulus Ve08.2h10 TaxID=930991 RepID=A0A0D0D478_9AGAM|nr:hypothetical protein PAXRUDRAFT_19538 [Paxillus rubicundulus Ve08.2h10]
MSGNTILLDIEGIVPAWDIYTLSLDIKCPGEKWFFVSNPRKPKPLFKMRTCTLTCRFSLLYIYVLANIIYRQTQSEDGTEMSSMIEQEQAEPNKLEEVHGVYVSCAVSPCCLLIQLNTADGEPTEKYMVQAFDPSLIDKEIAKEKVALEEIKEMCYGNSKRARPA